MCREVHPNKMMHNPIDSSSFLKSSCVLCRHLGSSAIRGTATSEGRLEGFKRIRMHILGGKILDGFRRFWKWRLRFWTFAPLLRRLDPLIFQSPLDPLAPRLLRASPLAMAPHVMTHRKPAMARTARASGQPRQVTRWLPDPAPQTDRGRTALAVLASPSPRPNAACGPVHPDHRPAFGRVGCHVLPDSGVQCIPCDPVGEKLLGQGLQPPGLLHATEAFWPALNAMLADPIEAGRRVAPQPCRERRQHGHHNGERGFPIRERRVRGVRNRAVTRRAIGERALLALFQGRRSTDFTFLPSTISPAQVDHGHAPF
jgi:hypothetical protein